MENNTDNQSPLRYPGGKTRACKILDDIINEYFDIEDYDVIFSPFFGGGSFEFYLQNKYKIKIIANDKFTPLYNFWNSVKTNKKEICDELYTKIDKIDKDEFINLRKYIENTLITDTNKIKMATSFFIINRCSFSGATLSGGFSLEASKKRFTKSSIDKINNLDLNNFEIYNLDFEEFLKNNHKKKSIIFLDPPYYLDKNSKLYGNNGDMHEFFDHEKLYKYISKKKNWIITYNNCDYIKDLYKKYTIVETSWSYGMNKTKKSSEIVIIG